MLELRQAYYYLYVGGRLAHCPSVPATSRIQRTGCKVQYSAIYNVYSTVLYSRGRPHHFATSPWQAPELTEKITIAKRPHPRLPFRVMPACRYSSCSLSSLRRPVRIEIDTPTSPSSAFIRPSPCTASSGATTWTPHAVQPISRGPRSKFQSTRIDPIPSDRAWVPTTMRTKRQRQWHQNSLRSPREV